MSADSASRIHDIGYHRYDGPRLGRGYGIRSLYTDALRAAYGLGRPAKSKIFPWAIVGMVSAFAIVMAVIKAQTGRLPVTFQNFSLTGGTLILQVFFMAVVAPEMVSKDLRNKTLPLYFSRPLRRSDYALAKLGALISAAFLLLAGPLTIVGAAAAFSADGFTAVWHEIRGLLGGYAIIALLAVVFSCISLLIASTAGRRVFAAGGIVAFFLVATPVALIVRQIGMHSGHYALEQLAPMINPGLMVMGIQYWLYGRGQLYVANSYEIYYPLAWLAVVIVTVSLLLVRYRRVSL